MNIGEIMNDEISKMESRLVNQENLLQTMDKTVVEQQRQFNRLVERVSALEVYIKQIRFDLEAID